ncbi:MAG: hypothetical protein EGQ96_04695, partial [Prevotella sp.]|nr:hypothetical protein [Prevotella sp.]
KLLIINVLAKGKTNYFSSFYPIFLRNPYPELALKGSGFKRQAFMATGDEWEENREHVGRNETRLSPDFHLPSRCRNYDFWRMPPRVQTSLGADANVAGSRLGCRWEQIRMSLLPDAGVSGTGCADRHRE